MAKRKVIEDSDDEDNAGDAETNPIRQPAVDLIETGSSGVVDLEDSTDKHNVQQSPDRSTGSTELLNRDIRAAHRSLIDPTPENTLPSLRDADSSQKRSQCSPSRSRGKIKRAKTGVEKPREKKQLRKCGTESSGDIFDFRGNSDEHTEMSAGNQKTPRQPQSSWACSSGDTMALGTPYRPRGNTPERERGSEMDSMPPPTMKSTASEQKHSIETATVSMLQDTTTFTEDKSGICQTLNSKQSFYSTHSDSRMPTPTMSPRRSDAEPDKGNSNGEDLRQKARSSNATSDIESLKPNSSASVLSIDRTSTFDRRDATSKISTAGDIASEEEVSVVLPVQYTPESTEPVILLPEMASGFDQNDELSLPTHGPETWSINQTTCLKTQKRKDDIPGSLPDEPGSDDFAIGLPKDHYQPRPSRSRSGRGGEEVVVPVDFSKRPEAIAKKKSKLFKRSKTTAFDELMPNDEACQQHGSPVSNTESKDLKVVPLQLTKIPPDSFSEKNEALEEAEKEPLADPKPPEKSSKTKKQRGRPKKEPVTNLSDEKVNDTCQAEPGQEDAKVGKLEDTAPSKKGNKGAKTKSAPIPVSKELVDDSDDELGDVDDMIRSPGKILQETSGNNVPSMLDEKAVSSPSPSKSMAPTPQTPQKEVSTACKGPDKHSPISSGKVSYRVGLSKRARIAPLLRIVRKP